MFMINLEFKCKRFGKEFYKKRNIIFIIIVIMNFFISHVFRLLMILILEI